MHISEGVLSPAVLAGGIALTAAGAGFGLRRTEYRDLAATAVLSAVFFTGSIVHVPVGPGNVHLVLNGLLGLILGPAVFPAILVALLLQAVLFGYGGLAVLGVNTVCLALPALAGHYLALGAVRRGGVLRPAAAFCCGALSVAGAGLLTALALGLSERAFWPAAEVLILAHIPVMVVEGAVTAVAVRFISGNCPELLGLEDSGGAGTNVAGEAEPPLRRGESEAA